MRNKDLTAEASHFAFGENWSSFAQHIDSDVIAEAKKGLTELASTDDAIVGASFLDIGCGSGLHSLAALQIGAQNVVAVDIDRHSVKTTEQLLVDYCERGSATVRQLSIFDAQ